jgi:hypothetical protein
MPPGGRLYVHHDPLLGREPHTTWFSWATEWDDMVDLGRPPNPQQLGIMVRSTLIASPRAR